MAEPEAEPETLPPDTIVKDGFEQTPFGEWSKSVISESDKKMRIAVVVALRAQGMSHKEITEKTGWSSRQIRAAMTWAYEQKVALAQVQHRLDNVAIPMAVDGLIEILDDESHDRHYDAIRDTLYGRGEFRNHSHSISDNRNVNLNLSVEYEMANGAEIPKVVQLTEATGLMVGKPREDGDDSARK